jgi:hypothetical protein
MAEGSPRRLMQQDLAEIKSTVLDSVEVVDDSKELVGV